MRPRASCLALAVVLAALLGGGAARVEDIVAEGIVAPFFDAAGQPTHRLEARRGTLRGNLQRLQGVEIVYFSAADPAVVVQRVSADEAIWDKKQGLLTGEGRVKVTTAETEISGEGFDFTLGTSLLHLHRHVRMARPEMILTGERATVELLIERRGESLAVRDVKRAEIAGHLAIVVQPGAQGEYLFERAYTELALYDGATQIVTLPGPTETHRGRDKAVVQHLTLRLKKSAPPPP